MREFMMRFQNNPPTAPPPPPPRPPVPPPDWIEKGYPKPK
ncbi:hypothetical protein ES707_16883 [subsurface metagenome]